MSTTGVQEPQHVTKNAILQQSIAIIIPINQQSYDLIHYTAAIAKADTWIFVCDKHVTF